MENWRKVKEVALYVKENSSQVVTFSDANGELTYALDSAFLSIRQNGNILHYNVNSIVYFRVSLE